ncbi:MAG: CRISPR-associated endoribonuclease Cas6 [Bacteroidales bacterium]|nr:CRISPR-associated endoribonuclease Cas6 [Bacteroidales bacterium]
MRIQIITSGTKQLVPFNHKHLQVGTLHKWIGKDNDEHEKISLYSFSWLNNFTLKNDGLIFNKGASFFFSCYNAELMRKVIEGIREKPEMFNGLSVDSITIIDEPDLSDREIFFASTPIFIKRRFGNEIKHITYKDEKAGQYLTETLKNKMRRVGLNDDSLKIEFDKSYTSAKERLITYNNVNNKASLCPVEIKGKAESKLFAWNVGIGNSTGIGFGAIQ